MEEETDDMSGKDGNDHVLSLGSTFRDLQTAYLIISLVLSVGCGLLLIFLVWRKDYLQKPSHYLRCNLAVDDIIITSCLIPFRIYALFRLDVSGQHAWCSAVAVIVNPCLLSMSGTYLMMAIDLYYFVCDPLHYHDKVTTKRVVVGIVMIRAFSFLFGLGPTAFSGLPKYSLPCEIVPANSASFSAIFRNINLIVFLLVTFFTPTLYYRVFKEARRQQERDENRNLWIFQIKAFKMMVPQAGVWVISVATVIFRVALSQNVISKEQKSQYAVMVAEHVSILLFLTVSSIANPIIYSFRLREFRRACKELCALPTNTPPAVPAPRHEDMEVAAITGPGPGEPATKLTQPHSSAEPESLKPYDQAERQTTQADMRTGLASCTDHRDYKTASQRPFRLTVRAEVHAEPTPRSGEDIAETLPGQIHLDADSTDVPTSMVDTETDETTIGNTMERFALKKPPACPKIGWQENVKANVTKGNPEDDKTLREEKTS
ncbi:adenosine receptor A2b-like [Branchiostoma floridae]|uniref:Adenosine receptor A2b-like n=1 Tax=Branchiostoma floridae TaxID=7739 RepID=A0A9J7LMI1_BRAFL|nr:adenosine receptor A2b-like [Branchiostoma floridae]